MRNWLQMSVGGMYSLRLFNDTYELLKLFTLGVPCGDMIIVCSQLV
jgi:hypothetical protein